jgi:predicted nucleic acid-binding protein
MTRAAEPILVDTNVLVDATNTARPRHSRALAFLGRPQLVVCAQVIREYLVIATRPPTLNGLGLEPSHAMANMQQFRRLAALLPEEKPLLPRLLDLLSSIPCRGKQVHDASLVAAMLAHDVPTLVTSNPGDFSRFGGLIGIVEP